ncbi:hypothetical protein HRR83_002434 [Exophiala dermatitidis]|uniref:SHSP domain-containing protein n=2 Tax=Exophiala dermatitidis TaxID=5970 RepID=H6C0V8_EXODN|nr:uncharacterized protein HMPREF1120_04563 [Exophiala dermatitidis NIH/UT8656]KAJ4520437.1 hypothetical protein HRR75_002303 [Exophiala dermatitidis]EHY56482.1 hypothetical protein HMPREF1120_04563 [Exophiala dermatitidis NIH/UT8656]KAJ4524314.1 hypothetical protein HRR74_002512 [Exophiala dermatitidis]KAJ4525414.1 hypothetical protein HRR73_002143 [Exophiala dermatitidis]KAJ4536729.1 hypothetical protein HRR76_004755 [Exophiala dermatitidis]
MPPLNFPPPLFHMNPPPNPFWDFVAGIEDHPFFAQYRAPFPPAGPPPPPQPPHAARPTADTTATEADEKAQGKQQQQQTNVEGPPEVDPTTLRPEGHSMPFRGRGRFAEAFNDRDRSKSPSNTSGSGSDSCNEGRQHRRRGSRGRGDHHQHRPHGHHGRHGPHGHGPWGGRGGHRGPPPPPPFGMPPFMMFGGSPGFGGHGPHGPPPPPPPGGEGPHGHGHGPHPPPPPPPGAEGPHGHGHGPGPHGRGGFGWSRGRGGCPRGGFGRHGPGHRSPPHGAPFGGHGPRPRQGPFDLGTLFNNLGERFGVDLTPLAGSLGLDAGRFNSPRSQESDFEPKTDIFDSPSHYIMHLSLPGAKKSDVGVEWDGEHSVLRVTGVVHRPGVDEEMMSHLVVDGRKRETGVFEKNIRLGTQKEPASVDVAGITAKMVDGVLIVSVPKVEKKFQKKEVRIENSPPAEDTHMDEEDVSAAADAAYMEMGRDHTMWSADTTQNSTKDSSSKETPKEAEHQTARDDRSETLGFDHPNATVDTLPAYEPEKSDSQKNYNNGQQRQETRGLPAHEEEMSDWEKAGSEDEGEGEYVKINVD